MGSCLSAFSPAFRVQSVETRNTVMREVKNSWDVVIIGAGIGGLAIAISLASKTKHKIRILDASPTLKEAGAGIQITPNASRILIQWGLREEFESVATVPDFMQIRRYANDEVIGLVPANGKEYASKVWGSPHWLVHRIDYQQVLARAATKLGVTIDFHKRVVSVDTERRIVHLQDRSVLEADLFIGADGIHSITRRSIPALADVEPVRAVNYCYRTLIPRTDMMQHDSTADIMNNHNQLSWAGHNKHIIGYPIARGELYNLVLVVPETTDAPIASYNESGSVAEMRQEFSGWHESIEVMLSLAESCSKWTLAELPCLRTWSSEDGGVVLLGDACHAMTPHAASGAATTLEDAEVLGQCIAACESLSGLKVAAQSYELIRKTRCERIQDIARQNATAFSMPDGPQQRSRDERLRRAMFAVESELGQTTDLKIPTADMMAPFPSPPVVMWLYGYDAPEEARSHLLRTHEEG